ncbi:hypothetical protein QL285_072901 [Trifolium repens]|nr:hypothetical protein QL285_072901 [Trifolium repens]
MVSSPRFRSPGTRSASAIVPVPENSSVAYHKEIYTVLFDPPSFLMVYSIVCHLWKKWKMKKFLPLPPIPIRKSPQESSIDIQEPLSDSISEAEEEISSVSTSVLESISANHHHYNLSFGILHSVVVLIKSIDAVWPHIEGCAIKIGEITCSPVSSNRSENSQSMNSIVKVQNKLGISSTEPQKTVQEDRHFDFDIAIANQVVFSINSFCNIGSEIYVSVTFPKVFVVNRRVNNTVIAVETVFDPGGTMAMIYSSVTLSFLSKFISICSPVRIFVFDPGRNRRRTHFLVFCISALWMWG